MPRSSSLATIEVAPPLAWLRFPYSRQVIEAIKEIPGRRWHPETQAWSIPESAVELATDILDDYHQVKILWPLRDEYAWIEEAFAVMSDDHKAGLYRALVKAFHPDTGGDEELMKRVNTAYGQVK